MKKAACSEKGGRNDDSRFHQQAFQPFPPPAQSDQPGHGISLRFDFGPVRSFVHHSLCVRRDYFLHGGKQHFLPGLFLLSAVVVAGRIPAGAPAGRPFVEKLLQQLPDYHRGNGAERDAVHPVCVSAVPPGLQIPQLLQLPELLHHDLRRRTDSHLHCVQEPAGAEQQLRRPDRAHAGKPLQYYHHAHLFADHRAL